jgi:predicted Fe-Mo cluster-binding NifX family protein
MKMAVTSSGSALESPFDPRFGRAANFIVFDTDSEAWECHTNNQTCKSLQQAGIKAAELAISLGAAAVISGHVGPRARRMLYENNILLFKPAAADVRAAIELVRRGEITAMNAPDPEGAWK